MQEKQLVEQELKQKLSAYFVRHEALGYDRKLNRYWYFNMEPDKVFVELSKESQAQLAKQQTKRSGGTQDDVAANAAQSQWGFFPLSYLSKHLNELDIRGEREKALREEIERIAREAGHFNKVEAAKSPAAGGSAAEDSKATDKAPTSTDNSGDNDHSIDIHVMEGNEHIGSRVRRLFPNAGAQEGTIVSWLPPGEDPEDEPLWHVVHDDGDEEDLDEDELKAAHKAYAEQTPGDKVPSFLEYRNKAAMIAGRVPLAGVEDDREIAVSVADAPDPGLAAVCAMMRELASSAAPLLAEKDDSQSWGPNGVSMLEWSKQLNSANNLPDGIQCALKLEEGIHSAQAEDDQLLEDRWRTADEGEESAPNNGLEHMGKRVRRFYEVDGEDEYFDGTIIKWRPAVGPDSELRWLIRMDDGDEASLNQAEVLEGIDFFQKQVEEQPDPEETAGEADDEKAADAPQDAESATPAAESDATSASVPDRAKADDLAASEALARKMAIDERTWNKTGRHVGCKCRRFFVNPTGKGLPRFVDGKV